MIIQKISSFHSSKYIKPVFKGEYEDRVQLQRCDYNRLSWWLYGEDEAKEAVEKNMKEEIRDLEKDITQKKIERDGAKASLNDLINYHSSALNSKNTSLENLKIMQQQNKSNIKKLENSLEYLKSTHQQIKKSNHDYFNTINEQKDTKQKIQKKNTEIIDSLKSYEQGVQLDTKSKIQQLKISEEQKINELENKQNASIKVPDVIRRKINCPAPDGFGAIAGYKQEKEEIKKLFGEAVVLERYGEKTSVPNGILLFGPDSELDDMFAFRIAKQYDTEYIELNTTGNEAQQIAKLRELAKNAQKTFETTGKRTVIHIKDFEHFVPKESRLIGPMKSFMDNISEQFHATVIATCNNPDAIDDILLRTGRFEPFAIPPVNSENTSEMIKRFMGANLLAEIKTEDILERIKLLQTGGFYTYNSLKNIIQNMIPNISEKSINAFKKQIEFVKNI